jgi:hypothetical protein
MMLNELRFKKPVLRAILKLILDLELEPLYFIVNLIYILEVIDHGSFTFGHKLAICIKFLLAMSQMID